MFCWRFLATKTVPHVAILRCDAGHFGLLVAESIKTPLRIFGEALATVAQPIGTQYSEMNAKCDIEEKAMWLWIVCLVLGIGFGLYRLWEKRYFGSIAGRLYINGEPASEGHTVVCQYVTTGTSDGAFTLPGIRYITRTKTDGSFHFFRVPAEEVGLGRLRESRGTPLQGAGIHPDVEQIVQIEAGKKLPVCLGECKVCIGGKLSFADDLPREDWVEKRAFWLERQGRLLQDVLGKPIPGPAESTAPANRDPTADDIRCWYHVSVRADGSFEVPGVRQGVYGLCVSNCTWDDVYTGFPVGHCGIGFKLVEVRDSQVVKERIELGDIVVPRSLVEPDTPGELLGVAYRNGKPAPKNVEVSCSVCREWEDEFDIPGWNACGAGMIWDETVRTDVNGYFSFKELPAGEASVCYGFGNKKGALWKGLWSSDGTEEDFQKVLIGSGQTTHVVLGDPPVSRPE
jgi:hypothetical protein